MSITMVRQTYFWSIEHHRWETRRHLTVQTDLDTSLNLVFRLDESIQQLVGMNDCFSIVRHETNESSVPLVDDLRERGRTRAHQDLTNPVVELLYTYLNSKQCNSVAIGYRTNHRPTREGTLGPCAPSTVH